MGIRTTENPIVTGGAFSSRFLARDPQIAFVPDRINMNIAGLIVEHGIVRDLYPEEQIKKTFSRTKHPAPVEEGHLAPHLRDIKLRRRLERAAELGLRVCEPKQSSKGGLR